MKYPVSDIFTYSPFLPHDYLCSEENDAGMDTGGGATDTASNDGGFVDDGSFDLGSNPDAIGSTSMDFARDAGVTGATYGAIGAGIAAGPAGVVGVGAGLAIDALTGGPVSQAVSDVSNTMGQGFMEAIGNDPFAAGFAYGTTSEGFAVAGDPGNGDSGGFVVTSYDTFGAGSG